jgi:hypothetical protein
MVCRPLPLIEGAKSKKACLLIYLSFDLAMLKK